MTTPWWHRAACKGLPTRLFFPGAANGGSYAKARRICGGCPVRAECLADAVAHNDEYGMWGGLVPNQRTSSITRERLAAKFGPGHGDMPGTTTGFWREQSSGLTPCPECRAAYNAHARAKRAAKRKVTPDGANAA